MANKTLEFLEFFYSSPLLENTQDSPDQSFTFGKVKKTLDSYPNTTSGLNLLAPSICKPLNIYRVVYSRNDKNGVQALWSEDFKLADKIADMTNGVLVEGTPERPAYFKFNSEEDVNNFIEKVKGCVRYDRIQHLLDKVKTAYPTEYSQLMTGPFGIYPSHAHDDKLADYWSSEEAIGLEQDLADIFMSGVEENKQYLKEGDEYKDNYGLSASELANMLDLRLIDPTYPGFDKVGQSQAILSDSSNEDAFENLSDEAWDTLNFMLEEFGGELVDNHPITNKNTLVFRSKQKAVDFVTALRSSVSKHSDEDTLDLEDLPNETIKAVKPSNESEEKQLNWEDYSIANSYPQEDTLTLQLIDNNMYMLWSYGPETTDGGWVAIDASHISKINPWELVAFVAENSQSLKATGKIRSVDMSGNIDTDFNTIEISVSGKGVLTDQNKGYWTWEK